MKFEPGAIIGDGDRNSLPFSVVALAPSKKTNVLFLEKIAPSRVTHARVCYEDSAQRKTNKMASEITLEVKKFSFCHLCHFQI